MQKILLITGWLWYIGSHAVVQFEQAGYKTVILDSLINSTREVLVNIEKILWYAPDFYEWDIWDEELLKTVFWKYNFEWVIHFAWLKAVGESCEFPSLYHRNNISWSIVLFEQMEKYKIRNVVFSSSATVYDSDNQLPFREDAKLWTTNPYGTTKLVLEYLLKDYSDHKNWKVLLLRYFNPIWAHESWYIWENPQWIPNNLLPYVFKVASGELESINVFWDDYQTKDGSWIRDYVDVVDLAEAHVSAYKKIETSETQLYKAINIGTSCWTSVFELIQWVEEVIWRELPKKIVWRRTWDIGEVYANVDFAFEYLGWKAKRSIHESLKNGWRFINKKAS